MRAETISRSDESGFTLVEVVAAIVIMSLVMGAISAALILALRLPDDARFRSANSVERSYAVQQFSDDVDNAGSNGAISGVISGPSSCPDPTTLSGSTTTQIVQLSWKDATGGTGAIGAGTASVAVTYNLVYSAYSSTVTKMTVQRVETHDGNPFASAALLDGYCLSSDTQVLTYTDAATFGNGRIETAAFQLRDGPRDGRHYINLQAATRAE